MGLIAVKPFEECLIQCRNVFYLCIKKIKATTKFSSLQAHTYLSSCDLLWLGSSSGLPLAGPGEIRMAAYTLDV